MMRAFCRSALVGFIAFAAVNAGIAQKLRIAVIPKGSTHIYWKSVEAGALAAGKDLGVDVIWKGPVKENDRAQQISIVEQFVNEGVSGIVLAPLDEVALARPVHSAKEKNIPVVIFDSALKGTPGEDFVSFVATNNWKGGALGGEQLVKLLNGKGSVVLLRYMVGSASTREREEGFLDIMKRNSGIRIIVDNRYAGPTAGEAKTASMNMIDQLKEADGIFCPNESSTFGMLLALRQNNLAGKKVFVGFDTSPPLVEALEKGDLNALVAQDPTRMGYEAVTTLVHHIRGIKVPEIIDTGAQLVTRQNLQDPSIRKLLGTP